VGMLLGARLTDPKDENARDVDLHDLRIKARVLMSTAGSGKDLSPNGAKNYSALNPDFSRLLTKTLVAYGDADLDETQHLTVRGPDWFADSFHLSPGADALLTLFGGKHSLGGVPGYDAKETQDEDPDRLAVVQRLSAAYLRSALDEGDPAWAEACSALADHAASVARVDLKQQQPPFREALS
jgi:hypothetical protein